ncbi:MAG TPA: FkbM family methyltransferase [Acidimicrobiales bacterium]|nr:FkbM family methyltransferase [Acidimicrobiales bacterium]
MTLSTDATYGRHRLIELGTEPLAVPAVAAPSPGARARAGAGRALQVRTRVAAAAIEALARWTPYVEREVNGLRELVRPGAVCVDVGASAGIYTVALSCLAGPTGRVHSIEPLPFANRHMARVLHVEGAPNVRRHAVALGADPGVDIMRVPIGRFGLVTGRSFLGGRAGGPDPNAEFAGQVDVTVTVDTLDALCVREGVDRLDFVKIDVEGAELQVLEGGAQAIEEYRPSMLVEIEARHAARYGHTPDAVTAWLFERGYTMHTWRRGWAPAPSVDPGTRNYLFQAAQPGTRSPTSRRDELDRAAA